MGWNEPVPNHPTNPSSVVPYRPLDRIHVNRSLNPWVSSQILTFIVWALSALALVALVLMHSGKGTGISDMIASSLYNANAATGIMERNLDRLTVIVAVVFAVCVLLCMFFLPAGRHRRRGRHLSTFARSLHASYIVSKQCDRVFAAPHSLHSGMKCLIDTWLVGHPCVMYGMVGLFRIT